MTDKHELIQLIEKRKENIKIFRNGILRAVDAVSLEIYDTALASLTAETVPVSWGAPKTVRQLIQQLQTLDPDLETVALLRMPENFRDGKAIRQVPIDISYERLDGPWLAPYKGDGRKVLAFWAKPDQRDVGEQGELLTTPPAASRAPDENLRSQMAYIAAYDIKGIEGWKKDRIFSWADSVINRARRALDDTQSPEAASRVPDGWKLMPTTATRSMIQAGGAAARRYMEETGRNSPSVIYEAMFAAAPSPTSTEGE
jgi:hypothetical protein